MRRISALIGVALAGLTLFASSSATAQESKLTADVKREAERIAGNCSGLAMKKIGACAATLIIPFMSPSAASLRRTALDSGSHSSLHSRNPPRAGASTGPWTASAHRVARGDRAVT
jgi:hypothetical protein